MGYRDNGAGRDNDGYDGSYGYGQEGYHGGGPTEPFNLRRWASDGSNIVAALLAIVIGGFILTGIIVVLHGLLFTN